MLDGGFDYCAVQFEFDWLFGRRCWLLWVVYGCFWWVGLGGVFCLFHFGLVFGICFKRVFGVLGVRLCYGLTVRVLVDVGDCGVCYDILVVWLVV